MNITELIFDDRMNVEKAPNIHSSNFLNQTHYRCRNLNPKYPGKTADIQSMGRHRHPGATHLFSFYEE
jgi:hypothetical protein